MDKHTKTFLFLGSDLTYGTGLNKNDKNYADIICDKFNADNISICSKGACFTKQSRYYLFRSSSYVNMLDKLPDNIDLIIVEGSINDYKKGDQPFGLMEDNNKYCFSGAIRYIFSKLEEKYQNTPIVFFSQIPCKRPARTYNMLMLRTYPLCDFVNREIQIIETFSPNVHIIDLYNDYQELSYASSRGSLFVNNYFLNEKGHELLADIIIKNISDSNIINK